MVARIASDPILVSTQTLTDFRSRQITGERALAQDSAVLPSSQSADTGGQFPDPEQAEPELAKEPVQQLLPPGAMFAAAVIAGRLSPRPETLEEVYVRIGSSWIPPESELRLRDFSA